MTQIVLAADARYLPFAMCSLAQVAAHGRSATGVILLTPGDTDDESLGPIRRLSETLGVDLCVVRVAEIGQLSERGLVSDRGHVSAFTYSKLVMANVLPEVDEVLYLDIDTLVRDDLTGLLEFPLHHPVAAVRELGSNGARLFGSSRVPYFNAGVLRMSLERWRQDGLVETSLSVLRERPKLQFQDQDVLNLVFRDRHDVLPHAYNVFDSFSSVALPAWKLLDDPAIVHFVGPTKPWHSDANSRFAREWRTTHARILGLDAEDREAYVEPELQSRSWQEHVHESILQARYSATGRAIRGRLPMVVKDTLNRGLLAILPRRSILAGEVLRGLNDEPSTPAPEGATPAAGRDLPPRPLGERVAGSTAQVPRSAARAGSDQAGPDSACSAAGPLVLVISVPRSGTNALNSMVGDAVRDVFVEGEFYFGHIREKSLERLEGACPWVGSADIDARRQMTAEHAERKVAAYRQLMSASAVEVTGTLLEGRSGPTVMKVFPNHLDRAALVDVLDAYRPRIIVLRRLMAMSYASLLKAQASGAWFRKDTTDVAASMRPDAAREYVRRTDDWFDWIDATIAELDLEVLDTTYEALFESDNPFPALRDLLWDVKFRNAVEKGGRLEARTQRQDRRTDRSVARLLADFGSLPADVRGDLLRHPGRAR